MNCTPGQKQEAIVQGGHQCFLYYFILALTESLWKFLHCGYANETFMVIWLCGTLFLRPRPHVSATFSFWIWLPSTNIHWVRHMTPQLSESTVQSGSFLICYESGIMWMLNPDILYPVTKQDLTQFFTVNTVLKILLLPDDANCKVQILRALRCMLCCQYSQRSPGY